MALTIGQTIDELHATLCNYIEATYHISNEILIQQRLQLLQQPGVIHQRPYLESTSRYQIGRNFKDLNLPEETLSLFERLSHKDGSNKQILHNPPWEHQATALQEALVNHRSLLVTTGTGSGKTECFLLPILGKLAGEASTSGQRFGEQAAVRALVLYPMNALVNDQLGRLRLLFADPRVVDQFIEWSGRAARFARYTSRTLYPGVRTSKKDTARLSVINKFYIDYLERAAGNPSIEQTQAAELIKILQDKGKWPAKDDLQEWYGRSGSRWKNAQGEFKRCITQPRDAELFTRHEVQVAPPDVLVTNYSMLEYMLMRPLERPIFEQTASWLRNNPDESFLLVIDEAHLYRGAAGAEVALLIRRLRNRLGIPPERLQVICTSASFDDLDYGIEFAAQLSGKNPADFAAPISGTLAKTAESTGTLDDAKLLADIDIDTFYGAKNDAEKLITISAFLASRKIKSNTEPVEQILYQALHDYGPIRRLINHTMGSAYPIDGEEGLGKLIFPDADNRTADLAITSLIALGSYARQSSSEASLLPARIHAFYRGLAGLWACMDPQCSELPEDMRGGPTGKLYSQPRDTCNCGARVLELFTCRHCGTAYGRAYTENLEEPEYLWAEPGGAFRTLSGVLDELQPLDLLIEGEPIIGNGELHTYDLITGQMDPVGEPSRSREVFIPKNRYKVENSDEDDEETSAGLGQFKPCAVCGQEHSPTRSSVQDHQTKGDQPFQALITKQIQVQAPNSSKLTPFAPQQGRKVLAFSDSRQTAARLAPNVQKYSMQDVMRPLLMRGYRQLQQSNAVNPNLNLTDSYLAVLLAAAELNIRLRPTLTGSESFDEAADVREAIRTGVLEDDNQLFALYRRVIYKRPPESMLNAIITCIRDKYYGLESLGLASVIETPAQTQILQNLINIPGIAESNEQKLSLARLWLRTWSAKQGFWLSSMPDAWYQTEIKSHSGNFRLVENFLGTKEAKKSFKDNWLPVLLRTFCEQVARKYRLQGETLTLNIEGEWGYCSTCRTTQRPFPGNTRCINCGQPTVDIIDPETHPVFKTRKGFYRASTTEALNNGRRPMSLVAAEHTAQLNSSQSSDVFSKAEEHELLFQDVDLGPDESGRERTAIDILSCTTTMEVGIDIGALSGVALRNMPPSRANYQQRAGRAGRRGTSVATVTSFGSADSHDEHYFSFPEQMISGQVDDPRLTMDNTDITMRHVTAYLLQCYHREKLPDMASSENQPQLFEVLGTVSDFLNDKNNLNRRDFINWITTNIDQLQNDIESWLPAEIQSSELLDNLPLKMIEVLNTALGEDTSDQTTHNAEASLEVNEEAGEERPTVRPDNENLLDRMLYKGVLPKYAFPTDIATFHVFAPDSNEYYPEFSYTPSQSLSVALTQYAPGKEVWIDNKLWRSGAIYSTMKQDRYDAWQKRRLYFECQVCHHSITTTLEEAQRGEVRDCEACGGENTLGPARTWIRPPGFAHRVDLNAQTTPDDQPARSYATRAKLMAPTPEDNKNWTALNKHLKTFSLRDNLLVTNRGPRDEGYNYCTLCGLIDPYASQNSEVLGAHRVPYPDRNHTCPGGRTSQGIVLGTDFKSDILLISIKVDDPVRLRPGHLATNVAMRTLSEAIADAGCKLLGLEATELQAEYRPAVNDPGQQGLISEIFLYDTLPGGAGFARRIGELGIQVMEKALELLEGCPDQCDRSCYRCLRSYKNKFEHDLLDRHIGASLLRYLLFGEIPSLNQARLENATSLLYEDLQRQSNTKLKIQKNILLSIPGFEDTYAPILITRDNGLQYIIGVNNPLTPQVFADSNLNDLMDLSTSYICESADELVIRRNLPNVTRQILSLVGE